MAWSAKLMSGSGGTQGVNEWQMVYNPSTQTELKLKYNFSLGDEAPEVLYHTPDGGSPIPVRASGRNRLIFLNMDIPPQGGWDDVLNVLTPVSRLVDGSDSQAIRAQIVGDVDVVKVAIKPDGATYTTYFDVLEGFVDASQAFTNGPAVINKMAYGVTIALTCKSMGYGDSFTLLNKIPSSPHFVEDSDADGLADGWTEAGTPTTTIDTTNYLIGGKAQKIVTTGSGHGIVTGVQSVTNGDTIVASILCYVPTGSLLVRLRNVTDSSNLDTAVIDATDSVGVSSRTYTDRTGATWYQVVVSGTNSTGGTKDYRLDLVSNVSVMTAYVDGAYFRTGTSSVPRAFSSARTLYNLYDPGTDTDYINYLDTWGIPGDAPATLVTTLLSSHAGETYNVYAAYGETNYGLSSYVHWHESNTLGGVGTNTADATRSAGTYYRLTGITSYLVQKNFTTFAQYQVFAQSSCRVYGIIRSSATTSTIALANTSTATAVGDAQSPNAANSWELVDLGLYVFGQYDNEMKGVAAVAVGSGGSWLHFTITTAGAGVTFDIDAILTIPINYQLMVFTTDKDASAANPAVINGLTKAAVSSSVGTILPSLGIISELRPGKMARLYWIESLVPNNTHTLTTASTITLTVTPKTRHLLGTI